MDAVNTLPLPRRIWWPWNEPAASITFTRVFQVNTPVTARLYVACSGDYQLWLDSQPVAVLHSHLPSWRSFHLYEITLTTGEHHLRLQAAPGQHGQPFLLANLDWQENSLPQRLVTDETWQMTTSGQETRPAWAFDGVWAEPWGMPCNAPDDFCRLGSGWQTMTSEHLLNIARLYPGSAALGATIQAQNDGSLEIQPPPPFPLTLPRLENTRPRLEWYRSREAHSMINNAWLDLFETRCPHAIFDAGAETFARLRVTVRSGGPAMIALTTGESLNEVNRYARRVTDLFELQDGQSFTTSPTGFRYVKLLALSAGQCSVLFDPIEVQHIRYPVTVAGQFSCSDETLNAIFRLSTRTLHLCMQNEIWDGIKRDQLPWMGDLYTEALAAYTLFGDYRLARRSLAVLAEIGPAPSRPLEQQRYPGLTTIWKTASGEINDIPSYTLWWLVGLWDYWMYSGDTALVSELSTELEAALEQIARSIGPDGLWRLVAGWDFVDWAPLTPFDRSVYCHLLAARALGLGAELLEALGKDAASYRNLQSHLTQAARTACHQQGRFYFGDSHHANAQAVCSGILTASEMVSHFEQTLQPDPPLSMTYWHRYLDLAAAAQVGAVPWGQAYIRRHWGQALQIGMTSLWEAFDPAWLGDDPHAVSMIGAGYARYGGYETSLCHGWSAGPAVWLQQAVLGVTPAQAGFSSFHFQPHLGDLDWAEGSIPTPHGIIHVRLEKRASEPSIARLDFPAALTPILPESIAENWKILPTPIHPPSVD